MRKILLGMICALLFSGTVNAAEAAKKKTVTKKSAPAVEKPAETKTETKPEVINVAPAAEPAGAPVKAAEEEKMPAEEKTAETPKAAETTPAAAVPAAEPAAEAALSTAPAAPVMDVKDHKHEEEKTSAPKGCVVGLQNVTNFYEVKTEEVQRFQKRAQSKLESFFSEVNRLGGEIVQAQKELTDKEESGGKDKETKKVLKEMKAKVKGLNKSLAAAKKQVRQQCLLLIDELSEMGDSHLAEFEKTYKAAVKYIKSNSEYEGESSK